MRQEILDYLKTQKIGVLAVEMPDGSPHAATVHFAHTEDPFEFFFETYRDSRKAEALLAKETVRASFVVGVDEKNMKTLQLDGTIRVAKPDEKEVFDAIYLAKFPSKKEKSNDPIFMYFKFTPSWWRFTDWTAPEGKLILTS
ncbi:MAG: pyridoxamine 5'-phosphate oxidase family protein [Patescibacteria group bacterium]